MPTPKIDVVRVYEDSGRRRGEYRALVDRLWPRGVTKGALDYDEWAKNLAPSSELRRWYGHDPDRFTEFARRYRAELGGPESQPDVIRLRGVCARRRLILLTATRDVDHSGAVVLKSVLERRERL